MSSKKDLIIEAWEGGQHDLWKLSQEFATTPSYIASVLQKSGLIEHYHDLFITPKSPINVYCDIFKNNLGFKTVATSEKSVALIEAAYQLFGDHRDRAGQHHCMVMALTQYNRALAAGKYKEANVFRAWLLKHISQNEHDALRDPRVA